MRAAEALARLHNLAIVFADHVIYVKNSIMTRTSLKRPKRFHYIHINEMTQTDGLSRVMRKHVFRVPTRSDTNRAVQQLKAA